VLTSEFLSNGEVRVWTLTHDGASASLDQSYEPTLYVRADDRHDLDEIEGYLRNHPIVTYVRVVSRRPGWRHDSERVLQVAVDSLTGIDEVARQVTQYGRPGGFQCFNVDFSREFRYCLETGRNPSPGRDLDMLRVASPRPQVSDVEPLSRVTVGETTFEGEPSTVAADVATRIQQRNPDVLRVSSADLIPRLFTAAPVEAGAFTLGRKPGYRKRASESTYESYGQVGHSPARYSIPGRVIIDESNSFFLEEAGLDGILDLVERSGKPLQEAAWASIGNILTAIQIQYAADHDVLVPWRSWRTERFKTASQLDAADRGGFTFEPEVGVHDNIHELDFSSLYPNIICEHNISPETIRCECHSDREDAPGLRYSICPSDGYLPEVLRPIIDDRAEIKAALAEAEDPDRIEALEARSAALKWILVSCFGYQGFSNAKFGRIEAHEAINAFAREIILDAKAAFEDAGYRVLHGIIDSIWVQPRDNTDQKPLADVATAVSEKTGIRLEHEATYDWVAFCPTADGREGALTKYYGRTKDGDWKYRGIECRQRSTPEWIAEKQREFIQLYDETRSADAVLASVREAVRDLRTGDVAPSELVIRNRVTKTPTEYNQETRNVAALRRATEKIGGIAPGEDIEYVVVDDGKSSRDRVELGSENPETYDEAFYTEELTRAAAGVLGPLGWSQDEVYREIQTGGQLELDVV
jgi:DNA polymerase I